MYVCNRKKGMRFSHDLIETAYNKLMTSVQYTGEVSFLRVIYIVREKMPSNTLIFLFCSAVYRTAKT